VGYLPELRKSQMERRTFNSIWGLFSSLLKQWFERRRALRELQANQGQDGKAYSRYFSERIIDAKREFDEGRQARALEIWRGTYAQFPDLCLQSEKAFSLFIDLGCHEEAEALVQQARARNRRHQALFDAYIARIAYHRRDLEKAARLCRDLRRKFPRSADGYTIAATCLTELGRLEEADEILGSGVSKLADGVDMYVRHARHAMLRRDFPEALRRWKLATSRFEYAVGPLGWAGCLREMGRFAEAEQVLQDADARFPGNDWILADLAANAAAAGELDKAVTRWQALIEKFPAFLTAYTKCAEAMQKTGLHKDGDELLRVAVTRFPSNLSVHLEYARSTYGSTDPEEARKSWALVRDRFPTCAEATEREHKTSETAGKERGVLCSTEVG
jgi:predicted Zn-dependent protease